MENIFVLEVKDLRFACPRLVISRPGELLPISFPKFQLLQESRILCVTALALSREIFGPISL